MSSSSACRNCGCSSVEKDSARGDTVCTNCGAVLEENAIVSEVQFAETGAGGFSMVGQFVSGDRPNKVYVGGMSDSRQSREITIQNAKRRIYAVGGQLRLNRHCMETALNFYKMALSRGLTRGRPLAFSLASCLYITCRLEGTPHFLLDFSDILQLDIYSLGRAFNALAKALYISLPPTDPCVYIMRFANALDFGDKEHDVAMVALRLVQRMKRDWMAIGRRPTGLCGAALLLAARFHNFNRSVGDIVRVVNIGESAIRKRLDEFAATPSSALTLDDFQVVDLEDECDPPIFGQVKTPKKKCELLDELDLDIEKYESDLLRAELEVEAALETTQKKRGRPSAKMSMTNDTEEESSKKKKGKKSSKFEMPNLVPIEMDDDDDLIISQEFLNKETLREILVTTKSTDDSKHQKEADKHDEQKTPLQKFEQYRPTLESLGITNQQPQLVSSTSAKVERVESKATLSTGGKVEPTCHASTSTPIQSEELELADIDDDEINSYLLREDEISIKRRLWMIHYEPYMLLLEEKRQKREEEQKQLELQGKKRLRRPKQPKDPNSHQPAASFGEAMEKVVIEKKLSSKINYEVLKALIEPAQSSTPVTSSDNYDSAASTNVEGDVIRTYNASKLVETPLAPSGELKPTFRRRLVPKVNFTVKKNSAKE